MWQAEVRAEPRRDRRQIKAHHSGFCFSFFLPFASLSGRLTELQTFTSLNISHLWEAPRGNSLHNAEGQRVDCDLIRAVV